MRIAVIGAGLYGRYIANMYAEYGHGVTVFALEDCLDFDQSSRNCASLINQARVHNGYHYPRSLATAKQSSRNYNRFKEDFKEALIDFYQVYAIPKRGSSTSSKQFEEFCNRADLYLSETKIDFVNYDAIDKTYDTDESAIDTRLMMKIASEKYSSMYRIVLDQIIEISKKSYHQLEKIKIDKSVSKKNERYSWYIRTTSVSGTFDKVINCTYSGINDIEQMANVSASRLKFEICEVALFKDVNNVLKRTGITIMDGQFVSFMPWSQDGIWSLTSVCYTPHESRNHLSGYEDVRLTEPKKDLMIQQLKKYVKPEIVDQLEFVDSKFVVKTVSMNAENDDNRLIHLSIKENDSFVSVLGGKLDAIYDLDHLFKKKGLI